MYHDRQNAVKQATAPAAPLPSQGGAAWQALWPVAAGHIAALPRRVCRGAASLARVATHPQATATLPHRKRWVVEHGDGAQRRVVAWTLTDDLPPRLRALAPEAEIE